MTRLSVIELQRQRMSFSAGHFTIFSATKREKMHGHNYSVCVAITTLVTDNGLTFDYRDYKKQLYQWCEELDEYFLIPARSPYLKINERATQYEVTFNQEVLSFPKTDVKLMPVQNITVEELSHYFLERLIADKQRLATDAIQALEVKVATAPGQSGSSRWNKSL